MNRADLMAHIICNYKDRVDNNFIADLNKIKILKLILDSEPTGTSVVSLENATGLHHDSISIHTQALAKSGLIIKKNKKASYHITDKGKSKWDEMLKSKWNAWD
jgi:predicted transcriptional regulator